MFENLIECLEYWGERIAAEYKDKLNTLPVLGACVVLILIPWYLVFDQPDLSTSIVLIVIFCIVIFAGGLSWKIILGILAVAIPAFVILISIALIPLF